MGRDARQGVIAQVKQRLEDEELLILCSNGVTAAVPELEDAPVEVGDVILYFDGEAEFVKVDDDLWGSPLIGVVAHKGSTTLLDVNGNLVQVPTSDAVAYEVGNTVEARAWRGVIRVIQEQPLRTLGLGTDRTSLVPFRKQPEEIEDCLEHFAGYADVVAQAEELIEVQLERRELLIRMNARPVKGVMFTGEPGTGKTMLARIIAKHSGATYYQVSGPQVVSKWLGDSELLLRTIFDDAAEQDRAVILFDEIDAIAGQRDESSHEASKRLVAELLTRMDGLDRSANIIVVATTNRPEDIDIALTRPGRFDWHVHFGLPVQDDRSAILRRTGSRMQTSSALPHDYVAGLTDGWSPADLTAVFTEAALLAARDDRDVILVEDYLGGHERAARHRLVKLENQRGRA